MRTRLIQGVMSSVLLLSVACGGDGSKPVHSVTVQKIGSGAGTIGGSGISCGATCAITVAKGSVVTLTATPDDGCTLTAWSGCDSTSGTTCMLKVNGDKTVTASFAALPSSHYVLTVQKSGSGAGTVSGGGGISCGATCAVTVAQGSVVALTATPDDGCVLTAWSGCDSTSGATCTLTVNADKTITASFAALPTSYYVLTAQKSGSGSGTVSGGGGISCGDTCSASFVQGATVELSATPGAGSTFAGWSGCDSTSDTTCKCVMTASRNVTASFTTVPSDRYRLTVKKSGPASGAVSGGGGIIDCGSMCTALFVQGATVELTATPDAGSTFAGWSGCDSTSGTICTFTMSGDRSVTASFVASCSSSSQTSCSTATGLRCYDLSVDPTNCGACGHACATGEICKDAVCTSAPTCPSSLTYCDPKYWGTAPDGSVCFDLQNDVHNCGACRTWCHSLGLGEGACQTGRCVWPTRYALTVQKSGSGSGTVSGGGGIIDCGSMCAASFVQGAAVELTATPDSGSTFAGWSGCDSMSGMKCALTMDGDKPVTASFIRCGHLGEACCPGALMCVDYSTCLYGQCAWVQKCGDDVPPEEPCCLYDGQKVCKPGLVCTAENHCRPPP